MGGRTGDDYMIMPFLIRQTGLFFRISLFFFNVLLGRRYSHLVLVEKKGTLLELWRLVLIWNGVRDRRVLF